MNAMNEVLAIARNSFLVEARGILPVLSRIDLYSDSSCEEIETLRAYAHRASGIAATLSYQDIGELASAIEHSVKASENIEQLRTDAFEELIDCFILELASITNP